MLVFLRRVAASKSIVNSHIVSLYFHNKPSYTLTRPIIDKSEENSYHLVSVDNGDGPRNSLGGINSLPFLCQDQSQHDNKEIKVVDLDTWSVSAGLACVLKSEHNESQISSLGVEEVDDGIINDTKQVEYDPDLDEIEDMRIHGNLFYKIERSSMEFQECKFDFHGRKPKYNTNDEKESKKKESQKDYLEQNDVKSSKGKVSPHEINKKPGLKDGFLVNKERLVRSIKEKYVFCSPDIDASSMGKKLRTPTFNQLTGPFHEPFCLDIHVSKGSVRACVIHRVTSKVVTVSHSISKDMKFNLGSTKSRVAAAAVGKVLAQRALADDIHDVIYTPRKGDKLEGKLQIVLQSIIDNGVNVKVRLKQKSSRKLVKRPPVDEV